MKIYHGITVYKILVATGSLMMLVACGKEQHVSSSPFPDMTDVDISEYITTIDPNAVPDKYATEPIEEENEPESIDNIENSTGFALEGSGYEGVVTMYSEYMKKYQEWTDDDGKISYGVQEKFIWCTDPQEVEERIKRIGYTLEDLSGDGKPELIISTEDSAMGGEENDNKYTTVLAIYGMTANGPVLVCQGYSRGRLVVLNDNRLYEEGSNGAAYYVCGTYRLNDEGTDKIVEKFIYTDSSGDELKVYENTTGKDTFDSSELVNLTYDDFENELGVSTDNIKAFNVEQFN